MDWENYRVMRNKVVSMRRRAIQEHFKQLCEDKYAVKGNFGLHSNLTLIHVRENTMDALY